MAGQQGQGEADDQGRPSLGVEEPEAGGGQVGEGVERAVPAQSQEQSDQGGSSPEPALPPVADEQPRHRQEQGQDPHVEGREGAQSAWQDDLEESPWRQAARSLLVAYGGSEGRVRTLPAQEPHRPGHEQAHGQSQSQAAWSPPGPEGAVGQGQGSHVECRLGVAQGGGQAPDDAGDDESGPPTPRSKLDGPQDQGQASHRRQDASIQGRVGGQVATASEGQGRHQGR